MPPPPPVHGPVVHPGVPVPQGNGCGRPVLSLLQVPADKLEQCPTAISSQELGVTRVFAYRRLWAQKVMVNNNLWSGQFMITIVYGHISF